MVLPFFGKKPPAGGSATADAPKGPAAPAGSSSAQTPPELSTLDFTGGGDFSHALAQCADLVEVQETGEGIGAAYEEAAVLYANGADDEAEAVLTAVLENPGNGVGQGLWMMLLDLYRLTGQRQRFESRVIDYAARFERSPPPWQDLSSSSERRRGSVSPLVNLSGSLSGQAEVQFKQIAVIGKKSGSIRIDLGRLRSVDETGCTLLRGVLCELAADRVKVSLLKCGQLASMLEGQVRAGRAEGRDMWLLMLEMLQHTGEHERFDQVALDYAITFEESPPSWEPKAEAESTTTSALELSDSAPDTVSLEGELSSNKNESIRKLAAFAEGRQMIEVDCVRLRRIDFVSAGQLFNILATLQAQGKRVVLQNVNAMVGALLRVMGVDQVAQVMLRP